MNSNPDSSAPTIGETTAKNLLRLAICEALTEINQEHTQEVHHPFIPPTAIGWIGSALVEAVTKAMDHETRPIWIPRQDPPEGFVFLHNSWDDTRKEMSALWAEPGEGTITERRHIWIVSDRYTEERYVTPWGPAG